MKKLISALMVLAILALVPLTGCNKHKVHTESTTSETVTRTVVE